MSEESAVKLCASVLLGAIQDYLLRADDLRRKAKWWIYDDRQMKAPLPFKLCCEAVGLNPTYVRERLARIKEEFKENRERSLQSWVEGLKRQGLDVDVPVGETDTGVVVCQDCGIEMLGVPRQRRYCDQCRMVHRQDQLQARYSDPEARARQLAANKRWRDKHQS